MNKNNNAAAFTAPILAKTTRGEQVVYGLASVVTEGTEITIGRAIYEIVTTGKVFMVEGRRMVYGYTADDYSS